MNMSDFREDYRRSALDRAMLDDNPIAQFESWFRDATGEQSQSRWRKIGITLYKLWSAVCNHRPADINAMTLATVDKNGRPSTRTVLLKRWTSVASFFSRTTTAARAGSWRKIPTRR